MTGKAAKPDGSERWPALVPTNDPATLAAIWPERRVRFMFDDGSTIDVIAPRDDSDLRGAVLKHLRKGSIVGSVSLPLKVGDDG